MMGRKKQTAPIVRENGIQLRGSLQTPNSSDRRPWRYIPTCIVDCRSIVWSIGCGTSRRSPSFEFVTVDEGLYAHETFDGSSCSIVPQGPHQFSCAPIVTERAGASTWEYPAFSARHGCAFPVAPSRRLMFRSTGWAIASHTVQHMERELEGEPEGGPRRWPYNIVLESDREPSSVSIEHNDV